MDVYYSDIGPSNLYKNNNGVFVETSTPITENQAPENFSWGTCFIDFDLDGWQDMGVANGALLRDENLGIPYPNQLFRNEGGGVFSDVSAEMNFDDPGLSRSVIYGDYDNDGDIDIFSFNIE